MWRPQLFRMAQNVHDYIISIDKHRIVAIDFTSILNSFFPLWATNSFVLRSKDGGAKKKPEAIKCWNIPNGSVG